jgi:hypothetical protein
MEYKLCALCDENIEKINIKPCKCELYYHTYCIKHIYKHNNDLVLNDNCDICNSNYNISFRNIFSKVQYNLYNILNNTVKYIYFISCFIICLFNIFNNTSDLIYYNISIFSLYFIFILRFLITISYIINSIKNNYIKLILDIIIPLILLPLNIYYKQHWLCTIMFSISSLQLVNSKTELFILSSKFPYCNILNYN